MGKRRPTRKAPPKRASTPPGGLQLQRAEGHASPQKCSGDDGKKVEVSPAAPPPRAASRRSALVAPRVTIGERKVAAFTFGERVTPAVTTASRLPRRAQGEATLARRAMRASRGASHVALDERLERALDHLLDGAHTAARGLLEFVLELLGREMPQAHALVVGALEGQVPVLDEPEPDDELEDDDDEDDLDPYASADPFHRPELGAGDDLR